MKYFNLFRIAGFVFFFFERVAKQSDKFENCLVDPNINFDEKKVSANICQFECLRDMENAEKPSSGRLP